MLKEARAEVERCLFRLAVAAEEAELRPLMVEPEEVVFRLNFF
jgi:hypothetical protein